MRSRFAHFSYRFFVLGVMAGALLMGRDAVAAEKYTPDKDPVKLGMDALGKTQPPQTAEAKAHFQEAVDNQWRVDEAKFGLGVVAVQEKVAPGF